MIETVEQMRRRTDEASPIEPQIRFVADNVPALMVYCDAQQRYKFVNTPYAERYGFTPDAVVGKLIREVIGTAAHEHLCPHLEAVLSGERVEFEERIDYERIGPRWVHCIYVPERQPNGAITGFFAIVQDVTDRKATEDSLRESEQRFRHMADHAPVMVRVTEADGACSYMSRNWCEFTGQEPDGALGLGWLAAVHPEDRTACRETIRAAENELAPFELDYRLRRKDGEYRWTIDSAVPRFSASGKFMGYIGSIIDITERKQMEEALRRADRRKDEFLATLSHELRNPLAPLCNTVELLRMSAQRDEPPNSSVLDIMERQVVHLVRLVDDLLEMSRISRGAFELRRERVELASVVRHAVETNEPLMKAARHAFSVTLPPEPLWLDGDPVRLAQILANLLNNAAKYTAPGGRVSLEARRAGTFVEIYVRDNGAGISADALPHLFEMFTRGPDVLEGGKDGLGIGLALAQRLVDMHGGRIRARSEGSGLGSEFEVRLPLSVQRKAAANLDPLAPGRLSGLHILVVDDNADAADSLAMLLDQLGAEVRIASNGREALEILRSYRASIVLLDIGMPGMNGYEVARRVRTRFADRDLALVAVSGWGQEEDRRRAREAGFDRHLIKPVDLGTLQAMFASLEH